MPALSFTAQMENLMANSKNNAKLPNKKKYTANFL